MLQSLSLVSFSHVLRNPSSFNFAQSFSLVILKKKSVILLWVKFQAMAQCFSLPNCDFLPFLFSSTSTSIFIIDIVLFRLEKVNLCGVVVLWSFVSKKSIVIEKLIFWYPFYIFRTIEWKLSRFIGACWISLVGMLNIAHERQTQDERQYPRSAV